MTASTTSDMIADLPDSTPICSLTLPGTHDTMTSTCEDPYYRTQELDLAEQLEHGVRFLDLRLRREMVAAHREWVSGITADSILSTLREHLAAHPRDFIIARVQNANEAKDDYEAYGRALLGLVEGYQDLFWRPRHTPQGTVWPTLGTVRGKVVALECSPAGFGLTRLASGQWWAAPWHDNPGIILQDDWDGPEVSSKRRQVEDLYHHRGDLHRLVLNHVSATNGEPADPRSYAEQLNPQVLTMLSKEPGRGVLILDFATPELVEAVWRANHPGLG